LEIQIVPVNQEKMRYLFVGMREGKRILFPTFDFREQRLDNLPITILTEKAGATAFNH